MGIFYRKVTSVILLLTVLFSVLIFAGCKSSDSGSRTTKTVESVDAGTENPDTQSDKSTTSITDTDNSTTAAADSSSVLNAPGVPAPGSSNLPEASAASLPRWRGFNLLNKFSAEWNNGPFLEDDFKWISELGFNYVRLPMDYRTWILNGDWNQINENVLNEIDQAVLWGRKYNIHVDLNFHRAPGYTVNTPKEALSLWTSPEAQEACARHWAMFAKRYKGIPNKELSFNLMNEPANIDNATYARVVKLLVDAIHKEDPERLIIIDGNSYATVPVPEAASFGVAQSMHNYQPFGVTHYQASWVSGADKLPVPQWPTPLIPSYLYGSQKPDLTGPWTIEGDFKNESELSLRVQIVSNFARLVVRADGKEVFNKLIESGPGEGDWKEVVYKEEWKIYQNVFDRDYTARIPANTKKIEIGVTDGDWLSFSKLEIKPLSDPDKKIEILATVADWGVKPVAMKLDSNGNLEQIGSNSAYDKTWLKNTVISPWANLKNQGTGVIIGEWGVYSKTPHDVTLRYMQDCLENFKEAGLGWALWNFRGDFGILDSNRSDVQYESFHGHMLDKKMLDLLQKY